MSILSKLNNFISRVVSEVKVRGGGYKIILSTTHTCTLGDSKNYYITSALPNPLKSTSGSGYCGYIKLISPYRNVPCLCLPYFKDSGVWKLSCNSIFASNDTLSTPTKGLVASAPGDGYVHICTGGGGIATSRCAESCPAASTNLTEAEVAIIISPLGG